MILLETPSNWPDYELIDSGDGEKLERFGSQILARPEPQAIWRKALSQAEWNSLANAYFVKKKGNRESDNEWGEWNKKGNCKEQWTIGYSYKQMKLKFRLGLTSFKHVGIFPEQATNWDFIYDTVQHLSVEKPSVLNLFAYTGGASLAARAAGADVTHVDSVKQTITWSRENMELSKLDGIRWMVDDAVKFVAREVRRAKTYNGIILDPPAYGRGPEGEKWILETNLCPLLENCKNLLTHKNSFLILNLYSMGYSPIIAESLVKSIFKVDKPEIGELYLVDRAGRKLPLGVFLRFLK
ncbi:MAG: class I SAM-dependent methyltransferase [Tenuifilum sp.]|uniref:class I SAM-dependent methyltransferase n=1 Tax=Tenuifilum sp. TaxID=2760880 RepID=UPI0030AB8592